MARRAWITPSGTRAMSRTFAGDASFSGFLERRILPVTTVVKGMPSAGATLDSRPVAVPIHSVSSARPWAASRACRVRTAVNAGYVCPPVPPPVTTRRKGVLFIRGCSKSGGDQASRHSSGCGPRSRPHPRYASAAPPTPDLSGTRRSDGRSAPGSPRADRPDGPVRPVSTPGRCRRVQVHGPGRARPPQQR